MIRTLILTTFTGMVAPLCAEPASDLLRFNNGDQLHGSFQGVGEGPTLVWERQDLNDKVEFDIKNLRHLVLRQGQPTKPLKSTSVIELINGDQIPGSIESMDEDNVIIDTGYAGKLTIPRDKLARLAPHPMGGRIHYHGPFSPDGWDMINLGDHAGGGARGQQPIRLGAAGGGIRFGEKAQIQLHIQQQQDAGEDKEGEQAAQWQHSGASWYWLGNGGGSALIREKSVPSTSIIRFDLAWKGPLNAAIGIHADFCNLENLRQQAENEDDDKEQARLARNNVENYSEIFGNAYILQMHTNYLVVYRSEAGKDQEHRVRRVQLPSSRLNFGENSKAQFEIRSNRETGHYSLFINGEFAVQWQDETPPSDIENKDLTVLGDGLGILPQGATGGIKLTDIIISEWNGMPDSARSMQVEDQDIILMTNGLDRLSGKALSINQDGILIFQGRHGKFELPVDEISEIHFGRDQLAKVAPASGQTMKVRLSPLGLITGIPVSGDSHSLLLRSEIIGDITVNTDAAVMFEFDNANQIFDNWDANF